MVKQSLKSGSAARTKSFAECDGSTHAKVANRKPINNRSISIGATVADQHVDLIKRKNSALQTENKRLKEELALALTREAQALAMAYHDGLTGLPNRVSLTERLRAAIDSALHHRQQLALLFIDLDGFKSVNDRFGHVVGDKLLQAVAARISACVRSDDIASRFGGDEFVVVLSNVNDAMIAVEIANKIRERIGQRYSIDSETIDVTASIGVALYPCDGEQCSVLLQSADASMYRNKFRLLSSQHSANNSVPATTAV